MVISKEEHAELAHSYTTLIRLELGLGFLELGK